MQKNWRSWLVMTLAVILLATTTTGCEDKTGTVASPSPSSSASAAPNPSADARVLKSEDVAKQLGLPMLTGKATVQLTVQGKPITIELDGANAPITAGNFVDLLEKKFYDGLVFHRVVKEPTPFVVQGGDPDGRNPNVPVEQLGGGGYSDPATGRERQIPLEIKTPDGSKIPFAYGATFSMIPELAGQKPKLRHTKGALAMARSQNPNSASSQFYITLADQGFLDGEYAVFGYVKEGMDVVEKIQQGDRIESFRILQMEQGDFKPGATTASPAPTTSPSPETKP